MNNRINLLLQAKNITAKQFAEEIGVQPSGMSHIMSGRNNPSLDFVMKVVKRYPEVNIYWLMFGKGEMYDTGSGVSTMNADPKSEAVANTAAAALSPVASPVADTVTSQPIPSTSRVEQPAAFSSPHETIPYNIMSSDPKPGMNEHTNKGRVASNTMDLFSVQGLSPDGEPDSMIADSAEMGAPIRESVQSTLIENQQSGLVGSNGNRTVESSRIMGNRDTFVPYAPPVVVVSQAPEVVMAGNNGMQVSSMMQNQAETGGQQMVQVDAVVEKNAFSAPNSISSQMLQDPSTPILGKNIAVNQNIVNDGLTKTQPAVASENPLVGSRENNGAERKKRIVKFIVLYDDHSFSEYYPEG